MNREFFSEAVLALFDSVDESKYNIALGFFQRYSDNVESDSSGKRFCDLKLHYKDDNGEDIGLLSVPLIFYGDDDFLVDIELQPNKSQLLVLWSDRSLEQWKSSSGTSPQTLSSLVKDGWNHAMAIPIATVHSANSATKYIKKTSSSIDIRYSGTTLSVKNSGVEIT